MDGPDSEEMTSELDLHIALDYMWNSRIYMCKVISKGDFKYGDILLLIKDNSTEHIHTRYPRETIILVEHEVEMFVEQRDMFRNFIRDMQERKAKLAPLFTALYNVDQNTWELVQDIIHRKQKVLDKEQIVSLIMHDKGDMLHAYTDMYNVISQIRMKLGMPFLPYKHPISPEYLLLHHLTPE